MRISDWSSDVCSSDLAGEPALGGQPLVEPGRDRGAVGQQLAKGGGRDQVAQAVAGGAVAQARASGHDRPGADDVRSEEHTSELQSLMRISYAVFCLKKKKNQQK